MEKPGSCPPVGKGQVGTCQTDCQYDGDCAKDFKCCYNGCAYMCQDPGKLQWTGGFTLSLCNMPTTYRIPLHHDSGIYIRVNITHSTSISSAYNIYYKFTGLNAIAQLFICNGCQLIYNDILCVSMYM